MHSPGGGVIMTQYSSDSIKMIDYIPTVYLGDIWWVLLQQTRHYPVCQTLGNPVMALCSCFCYALKKTVQ